MVEKAEKKISKTDINLWSAFIGEAKANRMYEAFAMKAMEDGFPEVAQTFLEVAGAETIHALNHLRTAGAVKSTMENLRSVVESEAYEIDTMYPRMIKEAVEEGNKEAAASFRLAWEKEKEHLQRFRAAMEMLQRQGYKVLEVAPTRPIELTPPPPPRDGGVANRHKEIAQERERIAALTRLREAVFGAQDGIVSNVAVVTSVALATGQSGVVLIAGLASALAGIVSMSTGTYLGSLAERDVHVAELEREAREIEENPAEELAELIEIFQLEGMTYDEAVSMARRIAADRRLLLKTMAEKELGLGGDIPTISPMRDALVMGFSFFVGSIFPIVPYFFLSAAAGTAPSIALALFALFLLGAGKGAILGQAFTKILISALQVLFIGTASAAVGYLVGTILPKLLGIEGLGP